MNSRDVNESFSIYPLPPSNLYIESLFYFFLSDSVFHLVLFFIFIHTFFLFLHLFFFFGPFIYFLSMFSPSFLPKFLSTPSFLSIVLFFSQVYLSFLFFILSPCLVPPQLSKSCYSTCHIECLRPVHGALNIDKKKN